MDNPTGSEKPVLIRAVTKDELTLRCEICNRLAQWIAVSRLTNESSAYCGDDILMFITDPNYDVPPELRRQP